MVVFERLLEIGFGAGQRIERLRFVLDLGDHLARPGRPANVYHLAAAVAIAVHDYVGHHFLEGKLQGMNHIGGHGMLLGKRGKRRRQPGQLADIEAQLEDRAFFTRCAAS